MRISQFTKQVHRRSYLASQFLRRHRTVIIVGAFVFWSAMLAMVGFFDEFGKSSTGFLIFGFLWMTVPMSFATYFIPRLLLRVVPLMNGYEPDEAE